MLRSVIEPRDFPVQFLFKLRGVCLAQGGYITQLVD